jgi:hypothetical protein
VVNRESIFEGSSQQVSFDLAYRTCLRKINSSFRNVVHAIREHLDLLNPLAPSSEGLSLGGTRFISLPVAAVALKKRWILAATTTVLCAIFALSPICRSEQ